MNTLIGNPLTEAHKFQFLWFVHFLNGHQKGLDQENLLCSKDCVFMHLTFPIINTVKEETVMMALLRAKPQHHFSLNTFFVCSLHCSYFPSELLKFNSITCPF